MIPRIIHQFWDYGCVPAQLQRWADGWASLDGWSYQFWTAENLPVLRNQERFDGAADQCAGSGPYRSHLACWEILHMMGGVWVDLDMQHRASFDEYLDRELMLGWDRIPGRAQVSIMGSAPGNPIFEDLITAVAHLPSTKFRKAVGTSLVNQFLPSDIELVDPAVFYPIGPDGHVRTSLDAASTINHHRWRADEVVEESANAQHDRQLRPRAHQERRLPVLQGLEVHRSRPATDRQTAVPRRRESPARRARRRTG